MLSPDHHRRAFDDHWRRAGAATLDDPGNARRVRTLVELCPPVASLLEIGCGHGDVLCALETRAGRRAGCDLSHPGLAALRGRDREVLLFQAAIDRLPLDDRAFDLVACCDVLEHLPESAANLALSEICRVAARYVLINLPFDEDLSWSLLRCACGHVYHRDHHQRSYSRAHIEEILPAVDFELAASRTTGWTVRRPLALPRTLGVLLGLGHDEGLRCERCGAPPRPQGALQALLRQGFVFTHNALCRPLRAVVSRDSELVALFRRREAS